MCLALTLPASGAAPAPDTRPRLLILTDISSLTAGEREPDDGQSLIRLLLYADVFAIEGLIASSNMGHGQAVRPELIRQAVDAYAQVLPNLRLHAPAYPDADALRAVIEAGQPVADTDVPVFASIGEGKDTAASERILRMAEKRDSRPLHVLIWGGSADLAQALWKARATRSAATVKRLVSRLRVHAIGDQDSTGGWIKKEFPSLYYVTRQFGYRGMYRGGDTALVGPEWVETHIRRGHGALGALYPNYKGGDIWSRRLGAVRGVKEGDTPSFLGFIPNGLNDPLHPERGGWGGRWEPTAEGPLRLTDVPDTDLPTENDPDPRMSAVYRWREAFQNDFRARLDWCVRPYADANHAPRARIRGDRREIRVAPGARIRLDASPSSDPDGDRLAFAWSLYPASPELRAHAPRNANAPVLEFVAPEVAAPTTLPLLLTVTDDGDPPLQAYRRITITVTPR